MEQILGKKIGMTQIFGENGAFIPVTVIEALPNVITQIKNEERDGYNAIQVAFGDQKEHRINKPKAGHFKKAGVSPKRYLREFKVEDTSSFELGSEINISIFENIKLIDAIGISKGKGTAGPIKRWNQSRGPEAHGSKYHRGVGSLGASSFPSKVLKGMHMAGHLGHERITVQNLELVKIDIERNLLLVKGAIPGPKGGVVVIRKAIKSVEK